MNTISNIISSATAYLDTLVFTGSNIATTASALGVGSTTASTLEDGLENGSAVGTGLSLATATMSAYENNPNLFNIQDAIAYVESLSVEDLVKADQLLAEKGLDFEIVEELQEPEKVYIKNV